MFSNCNRYGLQLILIGFLLVTNCLFYSCEKEKSDTKVESDTVVKETVTVSKPIKIIEVKLVDKKPVDDFNDEYDVYFKKYSKRYFSISTDYRWFKSQAMAESRLDPDAISPAGAKGIMQIMDPTYKEIKQRNKEVIGNVFEARWNIEAGIYYDLTLYKQWASPRPESNRLALMFASYNAGLGNILKAQKICDEKGNCNDYPCCNLWLYIKSKGHEVNSWKEEETIGYVDRIFRFMEVKY
jgi:membrane-bound lytic murein transglycosylase F